MKQPPFLQKGDTIALTCPAGYMAAEKAAACIKTLTNWGYNVLVGKTVGSNSANYFSGTATQRLDELQAMLDATEIKAILCARGGYGTTHVVDQLDFSSFRKNPKWIIGFSDITVLHAHINTHCKTATLHAPMAGAFNNHGFRNQYVRSLKQALEGVPSRYECKPHAFNQSGLAEGELVGGNLALLAHLVGTTSMYKTKNKILFLEDVGEQLYNVERMMLQLQRSGHLAQLAGLLLGGFTDMKDTERPFGKSVNRLLHDLSKQYNFPVCFHFPVSHETRNVALKVGVAHRLSVNEQSVQLSEL
jgi:muramoyltetrapeptide carboxypeptidase